jgi:hypothetical protein
MEMFWLWLTSLFQKFKITLKGCQFESVQNTQEKLPKHTSSTSHIERWETWNHHTNAGEVANARIKTSGSKKIL